MKWRKFKCERNWSSKYDDLRDNFLNGATVVDVSRQTKESGGPSSGATLKYTLSLNVFCSNKRYWNTFYFWCCLISSCYDTYYIFPYIAIEFINSVNYRKRKWTCHKRIIRFFFFTSYSLVSIQWERLLVKIDDIV